MNGVTNRNDTYDAWGKLLTTTGSLASTLGAYNPLRYRGYVYDRELGLYYLQSRYYDPDLCRFLNADIFVSTGQGELGNNMFAYCLNNPVIYVDKIGALAQDAIDLNDEDDETLEPDAGGGGTGFWSGLMSTMDGLANGLNMAAGTRHVNRTEMHHVLSNKHSKYTPQYKEIMERNNMKLSQKENIVAMAGHGGRHTNAYHQFMLNSLTELDAIAGGNTEKFYEGFLLVVEYLQKNPWLPYAR